MVSLVKLIRKLPFMDLRKYRKADFLPDLSAAGAVTLMVVPQGIAYALIAGLPPAMGLFAAALPVIIGSLFRSSRHVITGPVNAISVLVGASVIAETTGDPVQIALSLALLTGLMQVAAGSLRLGALLDYVSRPVLLGFTTGAAVLIAAGQLPNLTRTGNESGNLINRLYGWYSHLGGAHLPSILIAISTAVVIIGIRRFWPRLPAATVAIIGTTAMSMTMGWSEMGIRVVSDLTPVPRGFPSLTIPTVANITQLIPLAGACTVLSLVETSAIARSLSIRTGQRISISTEFIGEGLANITASFFGGYPTAGSLSRSTLNHGAGAKTRLAGILSGCMVILVLVFFGNLVDYTPIASLAGLLFVVAYNLIEHHEIRQVLNSHFADRIAFTATMLGAWVLHLDQAIYLGVGISLVLFLQRLRVLAIREIGFDDSGRPREVTRQPEAGSSVKQCRSIHLVNLEGSLFFGAACQLESALDELIREPSLKVLILRLKRTQHIDITAAHVLSDIANQLRQQNRTLILVGVQPAALRWMGRTGVADQIGRENLFPTMPGRWFRALEASVVRALEKTGKHACGDNCPLHEWLRARKNT